MFIQKTVLADICSFDALCIMARCFEESTISGELRHAKPDRSFSEPNLKKSHKQKKNCNIVLLELYFKKRNQTV